MAIDIDFILRSQNRSEIQLKFSSGDITTLYFLSSFPFQAQKYYKSVISELLKKYPNLSPKDDLFNIFTRNFVLNSLEMPVGIGTSRDEERIRIGNRIKEIRDEKGLDAKTLSQLAGIDAANLCRIEQGKVSVGIDILSKIARAVGYKIDFIELK